MTMRMKIAAASATFWLFMIVLIVPVIPIVGPWAESTFFPATTGPYEIVESVPNPDGSISIRFTATRHRACERVASQWYVLVEGRGWEKADGVTVAKADLIPTRPTGPQVSPVNTFPKPGTYRLHVDYDCGYFWPSSVDIGPFVVG